MINPIGIIDLHAYSWSTKFHASLRLTGSLLLPQSRSSNSGLQGSQGQVEKLMVFFHGYIHLYNEICPHEADTINT